MQINYQDILSFHPPTDSSRDIRSSWVVYNLYVMMHQWTNWGTKHSPQKESFPQKLEILICGCGGV